MVDLLRVVAPVVGALLGVWVGALLTGRRDGRRAAFEREAAEVAASRARDAAAEAWSRERRYDVHAQVLREMREMQRALSLQRRRSNLDELVRQHGRTIAGLRAQLEVVATPATITAMDDVMRAAGVQWEAATGRTTDDSADLSLDIAMGAYVEEVRLEIGQPVEDALNYRSLWASQQRHEAERREEAARQAEAAAVAQLHC